MKENLIKMGKLVYPKLKKAPLKRCVPEDWLWLPRPLRLALGYGLVPVVARLFT